MKSLHAKLLVAVLLLALVPAVGEVVENVLHLALSGHTAHAPEQGDSHGPLDSEHGCSGAVHVCGCHTSMPALSLLGEWLAAPSCSSVTMRGLTLRPAEETPGGVFHPPRC